MKDELWDECRKQVRERDQNRCRLIRVLSAQEAMLLMKNAKDQLNTIDPAHIFARSIAPHMKFDPDNVVCMNRYSHHMLEDCLHPITGESITKDEEHKWWKRIVGDKLFNELNQKRMNPSLYPEEE